MAITRSVAFQDIADIVAAAPDLYEAEQLALLREIMPAAVARAKAGVPVRKGKRQLRYRYGGELRPAGGLASLITGEVNDQDRRLSIGLLTAEARSRGFYGFILDAGRGLKRSRSRPRNRRLVGLTRVGLASIGRYSKRYTRRISPIPADRYDITFGRVRVFVRELAGRGLLRIHDRAVAKLLWRQIVRAG